MIKPLDGLSERGSVGLNQPQAGSWFYRSADEWRRRAFERVTCQIGPAPHELAAEIWYAADRHCNRSLRDTRSHGRGPGHALQQHRWLRQRDKIFPFARDVGDWGVHLPSAQRRRFRPCVLRETDSETRHKARQGTPPKTGRRLDPRRRHILRRNERFREVVRAFFYECRHDRRRTPRQFLDSHRLK